MSNSVKNGCRSASGSDQPHMLAIGYQQVVATSKPKGKKKVGDKEKAKGKDKSKAKPKKLNPQELLHDSPAMGTRSKRLQPPSPAFSTRSKRRLSL